MRIVRIQTGWVQIKSRHERARYEAHGARVLDVLVDRGWSPRLPIYCWLIEHPDGLIMVDTGESSHANDTGYQPWWHPFMRICERRWVTPEEEVGEQLKKLGHQPTDVRSVIMTHMHGDHAGGLPNFPKSEILLTREQIKLALGPMGPVEGYLNMHYPKWLKPKEIVFDGGAWETFDKSAVLTKDGAVRVVPTPGHVVGHASVVVEDSDALVFLAGDASYSERSMLENAVDGVAASAPQHHDTTMRIRKLCERRNVITQFAHDPDNERRFNERISTRPRPPT